METEIKIGKKYLVKFKGYQPVGEVIEDYWNGKYLVLCGIEILTASKHMLQPWCGEKY